MIPLSTQATQLFDRCYEQQKELEIWVNELPRQEVNRYCAAYELIHRLSHEQAMELDHLAHQGDHAEIRRALHQHPFHHDILLQSIFVKHALMKPRGYSGDKDLMLMICENEDRGETNFGVLVNRVYLDLPSAEAVRQRVRSAYTILRDLPEGSRVLNLAAGPALEVRRFIEEFPDRDIHFDLVDHDIDTIRYLQRTINDPRVVHALGNALYIMKGNFRTAIPRSFLNLAHHPSRDFKGIESVVAPFKYKFYDLLEDSYDLVYSLGLFDYIKTFPLENNRGAPALARRLLELVKPRGTLMIGNYMTPSDRNPHKKHHRAMMEFYSEWNLIYRSPEEIRALVSETNADGHRITLTDEYLCNDERELRGAIGILVVNKH